jgi:hypothetical protein
MGAITRGLVSIELSDLAVDGGVGTSFATLGKTTRDSVSVTTDDPDIQEILSEEDDDPVEIIKSSGTTTINFTILDPDTTTLLSVFGGEMDSTTWKAPAQAVDLEKSIKMTPQKGLIYTFTRCNVVAKLNLSFGRNAASGIDISATMLTPTKSGEPPLRVVPAT